MRVVEWTRAARGCGNVPEVARFFGIIVRMYAEPDSPHYRPHFHAYYQNFGAAIAIEPVEILGGELPLRQRRLVEAWAELHQGELMENWNRLRLGQLPYRIAPLR
jgi:hypothetical protein